MFDISNCLYFTEKETYSEINRIATRIFSVYPFNNGSLALKQMIKNYASTNNVQVKILYIPLKDNQLWGLFYQLDGIYFIVINSEISLNKQVVALAHEFYHLYSAVEENMVPLDILADNVKTLNIEDKKANAFAACFLMPEHILKSMLKKPNTLEEKIVLIKIVMDVFMVPFKTAVIRLMEIEYLSKEEGLEIINSTTRNVRDKFESLNTFNISKWDMVNDKLLELDDLDSLFHINEDLELMSEKKLNKHKEIVEKITNMLKGNKF